MCCMLATYLVTNTFSEDPRIRACAALCGMDVASFKTAVRKAWRRDAHKIATLKLEKLIILEL